MKDLDDDPNTDQFEVDAEETSPPDVLDFLRTIEMEKVNPMTRPMPSLDAATRPHVTPPEILELARPTSEDDFVDSIDFRASMDPDGAITVPESLRSRVRGPVRVRIFFDEK